MARLKTPISYYGGKQMLLKHILPLIPEHTLYTEAFCGGCAVLFAKPPAQCKYPFYYIFFRGIRKYMG